MVNTLPALKILWKDTFSVIEYQQVKKPNGSTGFTEVMVLDGEPCKLSFSNLREVNQNDANAVIVQSTKLFFENRIEVKSGSKIIVKREGRTFEFSQSGEPGIFFSHTEITLVPWKGWA